MITLALWNEYVYHHKDWLVIDIGAQVGQYTLFSAKMGRKVNV